MANSIQALAQVAETTGHTGPTADEFLELKRLREENAALKAQATKGAKIVVNEEKGGFTISGVPGTNTVWLAPAHMEFLQSAEVQAYVKANTARASELRAAYKQTEAYAATKAKMKLSFAKKG